MNSFDYLSMMRQQPPSYSSGYAQAPDQSVAHAPKGTQSGGIFGSICGLGGKGRSGADGASKAGGPVTAQTPTNQISVPYRNNNVGAQNPYAGYV